MGLRLQREAAGLGFGPGEGAALLVPGPFPPAAAAGVVSTVPQSFFAGGQGRVGMSQPWRGSQTGWTPWGLSWSWPGTPTPAWSPRSADTLSVGAGPVGLQSAGLATWFRS